ncbi:uncharacterized protein LOC102699792 [Oryza brachyantha]|uniref:uncharacterized protein LOC102699792 n=1 Tax=Oryza brachyantha TaxID=4533 RepID=UPI001ADAA935|nr:uncharacterized protein LOC102699792 [Oryza brachyantha]
MSGSYYCNVSYMPATAAMGNFTYADSSAEFSLVSGSLFMLFLAGFFSNLNLFGGMSELGAILSPRVRILFSSALSLFFPVMSYLFSEAKNMPLSSGGPSSPDSDLNFVAGIILTWMLLLELIRKKVDEIAMRGYSGTIFRAGRVVWLGSLVFSNIRSPGRRAVFGMFWVLCATKLVQRIAFTEVGKRSYNCGKNAWIINSYMFSTTTTTAAADKDDHGDAMLKRCKYIVTGEGGLDVKATADGYKIKNAGRSSLVTVGRIWSELDQDDDDRRRRRSGGGGPRIMFTHADDLKRMCLSFALFKLLRRRFEHVPPPPPEMSGAETSECRDIIFKGVYDERDEEGTAVAVMDMMNGEMNFLIEYYHSVVPVALASPFFLFVNYFLLPIVVLGVFFMTIILCGNGDASFAFRSLKTDNFTLQSTAVNTFLCLLLNAHSSTSAFFAIVNFAVTFLLFAMYLYEELWEFLVFLLSNWFMVSLLGTYTAKPSWRHSRAFRAFFRSILCLRPLMASYPALRIKQFSPINLRWPPLTLSMPPALMSLLVSTKRVPNQIKHAVVKSLAAHAAAAASPPRLVSNGRAALEAASRTDLMWACDSDSVAEIILTWHVATGLLEQISRPPETALKKKATKKTKKLRDNFIVATTLSRYCAYLVAFHPELLPDYYEKAEEVYEAMKTELKDRLGCCRYYFSPPRARACAIINAPPGGLREKPGVVHDGARLAAFIKSDGDADLETTWKLLAEFWTELIIYMAPSSDEELVIAHENVLGQGGEFITALWALTAHTGVDRAPRKYSASSAHDKSTSDEISITLTP